MALTVIVGAGGDMFHYGVWGKSDDGLAAAKKVFREHGGKLGLGYTAFTFPDGTEFLGVDDMGQVRFKGEAPAVKDYPPRKPAKTN